MAHANKLDVPLGISQIYEKFYDKWWAINVEPIYSRNYNGLKAVWMAHGNHYSPEKVVEIY